MVFVGTSGFSYDDWKGAFYPTGTPKGKYFEYYARFFDACEINSTYYAPATRRLTESLLARSRGRVTFSIKLGRETTHEGDAGPERLRAFDDAVAPLAQAGALGAVLAQFPQSFHPDAAGKALLERIREGLPGRPLVLEFRNARWADERVFAWMRANDLALCCVDEPRLPGLFPPVVRATAGSLAYLRLHGRNAEKWHRHEEAWERYDYLYSDEELRSLLPAVRRLAAEAGKVFVFANNHYRAKAVRNALRLRELLEEEAPRSTAGAT